MTLTDFLLARIAEDESDAGFWWDYEPIGADRWASTAEYEQVSAERDLYRSRVLAECEAKRRIMETAEYADFWERNAAEEHGVDGETVTTDADDILRALAAVYADHPDYRDEWSVA